MSKFRRPTLLGDTRGAVLTEFALVAPIFVMMLFGIMECGRLYWVKQTLDEVAYNTARCMSVSSGCATEAGQKTFAVNRAAGLGITIAASEVTTTNTTTCKTIANSSSVTIAHATPNAIAKLLPMLPTTLRASACFPSLT